MIDDKELREKIRRKCMNDWEIDLTEDQITMGIIEQEEQKLSIFRNQLWPNKRRFKNKSDKWVERVTWDKTIDGYRAIAQRNGLAGIEGTKFTEHDGELVMATVVVYKIQSDGKRYPFVGEARFDEFAPRDKDGKIRLSGQWKTAPRNQLSVAAQRQALRIAFQDCDDGQTEILAAADTASEVPEPEMEPSRGEPAPVASPDPAPEAKPEPKPAAKSADKNTGTFVGIPRGGEFKFGAMYNDKERIVLKSKKDDGSFSLALDSGYAVNVNSDGYETQRRERTDKSPGGRAWKEGSKYYGDLVVEKIAPVKDDSTSLWLALSNGFKVKVDKWGKEVKRKERKTEVVAGAKEPEKKEADAAPKTNGVLSSGDFRKLNSKDEMRVHLIPVLAQWCREINGGKKISPKEAYEHLAGVCIDGGKPMVEEDFRVLYECLTESLEAKK